MSTWRYDDYYYDYRSYGYSSGSGTRSWMSKIGYGYDDSWWKPKTNKNEAYQDMLNQLQNSANVIGDGDKGKIEVRWSNGKSKNGPSEDGKVQYVYLSPDDLLNDKSEVAENVLDGMTGKVYLASSLRDTIHPEAYRQADVSRSLSDPKLTRSKACFCGSGKKFGECHAELVDLNKSKYTHDNALTIWEAIETAIARQKVISEWQGFSPYIAADAIQSSCQKEEIQKLIDESVETKPTADVAALALAWNLLNSSDRVKIPEAYKECVEYAGEQLENDVSPEERFKVCLDISNHLTVTLGCQKEKPNENLPSVCDSSLLGDEVENTTDESLATQISDKADDKDASSSIVNAPNGLCDNGKQVVDEKAKKPTPTAYATRLNKLKGQIKSIVQSLDFRNTTAKMSTYGHDTGDIDENSLHKLRYNDDRIMKRDEIQSQKQIAVTLLVDESGSMSGDSIEAARDVAIVIGEALRQVPGIDLSIYGHSTETRTHGHEVCLLVEYVAKGQTDISPCANMQARNNNLDSWAMMHVANKTLRDYADHDRKIVFVISDGSPHGNDYGGSLAVKHMKMVCDHYAKHGIEIYGIGVAEAYPQSAGEQMYGKGKNVVLQDVTSSIGVMARFIRQIALK